MKKENTGAGFKSATAKEEKKLFIETYGCQMNVADSELVASIMKMAGYEVCKTLEEAGFRAKYNLMVIRVMRENSMLNIPGHSYKILAGDVLTFAGRNHSDPA